MTNKKISLVIPFYNEKNKIYKTIKLIKSQTIEPDEIIFVNGFSNDNSELLLRLFLKNYKFKKSKIKILKNKKKNPSESKNIGIKNSKYENICFMDFGLDVNKFWIQNIKKLISNKNYSYVQGKYYFKPISILDKYFLSQTFGIYTYGNCIPSSCFKKKIFNKIGFFENYRSGYDRVWLKKLKSKKFYSKNNYNSPVNYLKYNSGENIFKIFKKIFYYSHTTVGLKNYYLDNLYLISLMFLILIFVYGFFLETVIMYFLFRGLYLPIKKNFQNTKKNFDFSLILFGPIFGVIIDASRLFGFLFGHVKKIIK